MHVDRRAGIKKPCQCFLFLQGPVARYFPLLALALRARKAVVLYEGPEGQEFLRDPYFGSHRPRSLLCQPLLRQNEEIDRIDLALRAALPASATYRSLRTRKAGSRRFIEFGMGSGNPKHHDSAHKVTGTLDEP